LDSCTINNVVIEGITGCSIRNEGTQAELDLTNTLIEQNCENCPEVIQNLGGAQMITNENVLIRKD
jgi:hypothetical protein